MRNINAYVKDILNASNDGKLVFFIGAGVSTLSDYPQWWKLVDQFHKELYGESKGNYDSDELLSIPQIYFDVKGSAKFNKILKNTFHVKKSPNEIHNKILSLNPKHIITTNYDDLIEQASSIIGKKLSIVSQEEDLSDSISSRYLLKIHGDFRNGYDYKNIVLRENDYLSYDQNYPLISNLMKTIIATHTIVFIGYGLGDYNVNMLLNWVKTLQKDSFNKPVFIKTDPQKISQNDMIYYEKKGLRIIDAASLFYEENIEYMTLYNKALDIILDSHERKLISNSDEAIEYIYEKTEPLFSLNYIRSNEFNELFDKDYRFDETGTINPLIKNGYDYLDDFFEKSKQNFNSDLSSINNSKAQKILAFFNKNEIKGMTKNHKRVDINFEISNLAFESNYDEMNKFVEITTQDNTYNYKKAFYLAHLGRWTESYNLYSNLIIETVNDNSNEWIYYLSQINRYRIYQSVKQMFFSNQYFKQEFLNKIDTEMKNFNIGDLFESMSFQFKNKYRILKFLSSNSFLYEDTVQLFNLTNKVRLEISKNTLTFGISNHDKVTLSLYENLRFLYDNFLWVVQFNESKQFIKNSITLLIEKENSNSSNEKDIFGIPIQEDNSFELSPYYFISIAKNFKIDDVKYLENISTMDNIKISSSKEIEQYLIRLTDVLFANFPNKGMSELSYLLFIEEVKVAFYLARYIKLSENALIKIIKSMLFHLPARDFDIGTCYLRINSLGLRNKFSDNIIYVFEKLLCQQAERHKDSNFSEHSINDHNSLSFLKLIKHFKKDFISERLSTLILSLDIFNDNQLNYFYHLYPILNAEAKDCILQYYHVKDINDIYDSMRLGIIDELSLSHVKVIYEYLQDSKRKYIIDTNNDIISSGDRNLRFIAILYFTGKLKLHYINDYTDIDDEFDFFVQGESFQFEKKFNSFWLKQFNKSLLEEISADPYKKLAIQKHLKVELAEKKTNDNRLLNILLQYFI